MTIPLVSQSTLVTGTKLRVHRCTSNTKLPVYNTQRDVVQYMYTCTHKVRTYKEYHSVCPSSELGLPPPPHPQASVPPPPCFWGEGNTRWRERDWESPNSDEERTLWYSLYVRTLCMYTFCTAVHRSPSHTYDLIRCDSVPTQPPP